MLPQTNLQLYQVLLEQHRPATELKAVRTAYDITRDLFGDSFRPSHKPFVSHLIGTAGALAVWGQSTPLVVAGLLHSAYLYGFYDDGRRGMAASRRRWLREQVGPEAELLVAEYTVSRWNRPTASLLAGLDQPRQKQLLVIKLADTLDEFADGGTAYSAEKQLPFAATDQPMARRTILELCRAVLGDEAARQFSDVFSLTDRLNPPAELKSGDKSFHRVQMGIDSLRKPRWVQPAIRVMEKWRHRGAA